MKLSHLLSAIIITTAIAFPAFAHDPSEFLESLPPVETKTACEQLKENAPGKAGSEDAKLKKLQADCKDEQKAAKDKTSAEKK